MNAEQITAIAASDGVDGLARSLGISRRQATQAAAIAHRAVSQGYELPADAIPVGTVGAARTQPARVGRGLTEAEVREQAERVAPAALVGLNAEEYREHQRAEQDRLRRERNAANGHPEVDPRVVEHLNSERLRGRFHKGLMGMGGSGHEAHAHASAHGRAARP